MKSTTVFKRLVNRLGTQQKAADALGTTQGHISRLVLGRKQPSEPLLILAKMVLKELKNEEG